MKRSFFMSAVTIAFMAAGQASASLLSVIGGADENLPSDFDPNPSVPGLIAEDDSTLAIEGTAIKAFTTTTIAGAGLSLAKGRTLVYTFMGSEAGFTNRSFDMATEVFNENVTTPGSVFVSFSNAGLVDFSFTSNDATLPATRFITNGVGGSPAGLNLSFALAPDGQSYYALYGDNTGDSDRDDMIILITAVPVPAGGLLLLTALAGLGVARRRKAAT